MEASIRLGHIRGIPIGLHYSWFIVFGLLTYFLSMPEGFLQQFFPGWETTTYWIVAAASSLLLFTSVLLHELGHAFTAQRKGIPVKSITLFIFGGVASIAEDSETARDEFAIAIMGPVVSVAIALFSFVMWLLFGPFQEQFAAIFLYLTIVNTVLVLFNMIPGFPLDGGRVFRAALWAWTGSVEKATRYASMTGVMIGYAFIILGIFMVFWVLFTGIWLILIGWFLQNAADQAYKQMQVRRTFEGVRVRQLMEPNPVTISAYATIEELVDRYMLGRNLRGLPVVDEMILTGIITLNDIKETPREEWAHYRVLDRMTPRERLITAEPDTDLDTVLHMMSEHDFHQIPVLENGAVVGLLTRGQIIRFLQLRQSLPDVPTRAQSTEQSGTDQSGTIEQQRIQSD
jgi:Zn-dependent protease/predicted transcriptional regulator